MSEFNVIDVVEETAFRLGFEKLLRMGPLVDALLLEKVSRMKQELVEHQGKPPGFYSHPELDGSYVFEREALQIRYYITLAERAWLERQLDKLTATSGKLRVRVRRQGLDWPGIERLAGT